MELNSGKVKVRLAGNPSFGKPKAIAIADAPATEDRGEVERQVPEVCRATGACGSDELACRIRNLMKYERAPLAACKLKEGLYAQAASCTRMLGTRLRMAEALERGGRCDAAAGVYIEAARGYSQKGDHAAAAMAHARAAMAHARAAMALARAAMAYA